jgi:4-amino-4-deoxy-L-arabinose transferase-like glycosyltransferase
MTTTTLSPAVVTPRVAAPARRVSWTRPALVVLLLATAALYLYGLSASGWANSFYSAAAQAGSASWKAWFFGSSDAANSITVDKTPAALWVTGLSVRVFGLSSWSILVPQALEGVATVGLLYATVRRWFGPVAGLLAGAVLAITPVATLMFRFNNPDALLMLVLVAGTYGIVRALEQASTRWLLFAASMVGLGFLTKMLQALLVVPAFALVYLLCAPTGLRRRLWQLVLAGAALVASAGWWIAIVELTPAAYRPYIGGSQTNSILELTLGYNGLGRLTGEEVGSVGGGQSRGWGDIGWARMFNAETGGQIAWLLPAALILLVAGLALAGRAPRTDRTRAAFALWGGWLVVTGLVFSFMQGIFHAYYTVALAPAIGAIVGMGATALWRARANVLASAVLAIAVTVTATWSYVLLGRTSDFHPWLRTVVLVAGLTAGAAILALATLPGRLGTRLAAGAAGLALLAALAGPAAYSLQTATTAHTGSIVTAGPAVAGAGLPGGARTRMNAGGRDGGMGGGMGGLLNGSTPSAELVSLLRTDAAKYTWAAAAIGSNNASGYQLSTGEPVMAIGGFNGSDPSPTLEQFKQYVADGKIHYFIASGGGFAGRSNGGSDASAEIASWVTSTFTATTVGGATVYDLTTG